MKLKITHNTYLKQSPEFAVNLPNHEKLAMMEGNELPITAYRSADQNHWLVTLGKNHKGEQISFYGKNTWLVYRPHVVIEDELLTINRAGLELIKSFEGLESEAYYCPAGVLTIGYGHTGPDVREGQRITEQQAEQLLRKDLERFESAVRSAVKVSLTSNQFSALVSFTFNVGEAAFKNSTLLRLLNSRDYSGAADQFLRWNKAGSKELSGLTRRREAERNLFNY